MSIVCSQKVTACLTLACFANRLSAGCLLKRPVGRVVHYLPAIALLPIMSPVNSIMPCNWPAICNRPQYEASCHLLAAGTWHRFLLCWGATVGQMLKCQWWLLGGLVCTICYPYVVYTSHSEYVSPRQSVCHIFETRLYVLSFLIALLKRTSFPMYQLHVFA